MITKFYTVKDSRESRKGRRRKRQTLKHARRRHGKKVMVRSKLKRHLKGKHESVAHKKKIFCVGKHRTQSN